MKVKQLKVEIISAGVREKSFSSFEAYKLILVLLEKLRREQRFSRLEDLRLGGENQ